MQPFPFNVPRKAWLLTGVVVAMLLLGAIRATAQGPKSTFAGPKAPAATSAGTAFTYQGQLKSNGLPVSDTCDFKFDVFDAAAGTGHIAGPLTQTGVQVTGGLFTTVLDFGGNVFTGDGRWLHTAVACPSGGSYVPLGPRQPLTPAPIALSLPGLSTDQSGTSPNVTIHGSDAALRIQSDGSATYPRTIYSADTSEWHTGAGGSTVNNGVNGKFYVYDAGANKFRLVIDTNGNVGMGTTNPGAPLELYGTDTTANIRNSNDAGGAFIGNTFNALELGLYNPSGSIWGVIQPGVRRSFFGFDEFGEVGSITNTFPGLHFRNLLDDGIGNAEISGGAHVGGNEIVNGLLTVYTEGTAGTSSLCMNFDDQIATCSSSLRYKSNVADLPLGLDTVMQLRPVTFDWKSNGEHDLGFVAEEVNALAPVLTTLNKDGQIEGVKYDRITAVLAKGMQEQQQQIADEKAQNETLQKKSGELETQVAAQQKDINSLGARLSALEQAGPNARSQSSDWASAPVFVAGAVAMLAIERARQSRFSDRVKSGLKAIQKSARR